MDTTASSTGLRRRRRSPTPSPESLWSPGPCGRRSSSPDELQPTLLAMPLDDDTSESEASSSVRSTAAVQRQPDKQNAAANEQDAVPEQPRSELEQLTAENTALRAALSEEEKRNAELLALVRRADKEMQDITQRDRDLAGRLAKWREEVRDITYS